MNEPRRGDRGFAAGLLLSALRAARSARAAGRPAPPAWRQAGDPERRRDRPAARRADSARLILFQDEAGPPGAACSVLRQRPVVLVLAYYNCPMLCTQVLNGLLSSLRALSFDAGKEFEVVTVSFDPRDRPADAAAKKAPYVKEYGRPGAAEGWHFLTGGAASIDRLTQAVGFRYQVRRVDRSVRARERHLRPDAGRPALALLLRDRVRAARPPARAHRSLQPKNRQPGRRDPSVLLPLRSENREVRRRRDEHCPDGRRRRRRDHDDLLSWSCGAATGSATPPRRPRRGSRPRPDPG